MHRKKAPASAMERRYVEDGESAVTLISEERKPMVSRHSNLVSSDLEPDPRPMIPLPSHKKNSLSMDISPGSIPSRHKRSISDIRLPLRERRISPRETLHLPLPQLEEESSDMSESEKVIRNIIETRENCIKRKAKPSLVPKEMNIQIEKIRGEMIGELSQKEEKRRALKQSILELLAPKDHVETKTELHVQGIPDVRSSAVSTATVTSPGSSFMVPVSQDLVHEQKPQGKKCRDSSPTIPNSKRSSACSSPKTLSPEPKAQPVPLLVSSKSTNRKIVKNALTAICLAGDSHRRQREEVSLILDSKQGVNYFIIVFKGNLGRQEFAGLYGLDPTTGLLQKLYGGATYPDTIKQSTVQSCYRYDSSAREFKLLPSSRLSHAVDAIAIMRTR